MDEASAVASAEKSRSIVRDSSFARGVADRVIVIDLGRDLELACLQVGPVLTAFTEEEDAERYDGSPVYTEVVRLRLPWYGAVGMAMQILEQGIRTDKVHGHKIAESIAELVAEVEAAESVEGNNGS